MARIAFDSVASPTCSETANAAPTDCSAADRAASGRLNGASNLTICGLYVVAKMLPMIATPSVPPTSRLVSFIAEPTPAISRGNEPIIDSEAGLVTSASPHAINTMLPTTGPKYALFALNIPAPICATPMNNKPIGTIRFEPYRNESRAAIGEVTPAPIAKGNVRNPDSSGS